MPFDPAPLSGCNVGGWLSQSPLTPEHLRSFITQDDFRAMAAAGFNAVRVPFNAALVWDGEALDEAGAAWMDRALAWGREAGLTVVLDLHEIPGHSFTDPSQNDLYANAARRRNGARLWQALARRYVAEGNGLWFELLNEPVAPGTAAWVEVAEQWLAGVREVDERRPVVVGSNLWNGPAQFAELPKLDDPRIVYTFHFYEPHSFTHQGAPWVPWAKDLPPQPYPGEPVGLLPALRAAEGQAQAQAAHLTRRWDKDALEAMLGPVLDFRARHQVPVFCGEFGVHLKAPRADQLRWLGDFCGLLARHRLGFCYWSWRGMSYGLHYESGEWAGLEQYRLGGGRDRELLALLKDCAASLQRPQ